tara:strand:+ start:112 stop:1602 length:1491 start_codon:yes stop_codon:yes gene_type:complete
MKLNFKLFWVLAIFLFTLSCNKEISNKVRKKPNILLIFTDDQRSDALGIAQNTEIKTPNIDNLARSGVYFKNSYVMGGHHGAICAPSRAMLLSGKSLFHVYDSLEGVKTLPNSLSNLGYKTFATGKWHNGEESFEANFQEGAQIMIGGMSDHFKVPVKDLNEYKKLTNSSLKGFSTDIFTEAALDYLDRYQGSEKQKPFFCYLAFTAPHDPRSPAPKYSNAYTEDEISIPENFKPLHPFRFDDFNIRDETLAPWPRSPGVIQSSISEYYALIQHIDDRVGDLIKRLKKYDLYDNTLIIYASDNGLALGSHGLLGKQNLYEHSTKVPLIISGPGIPKGQTSDALVYLFDIFPTLMDYLDFEKPEDIDGKSLLNIINKKENQIRTSIYTAYRNTVRAVRDNEWKLIFYPQIKVTQLYNLKQDPNELYNLAQNLFYKTRIKKMMNLLKYNMELADDTINLNPSKIQSKEYNYKNLVQKLDPWQPKYIIEKYFPEGTSRN